MTTARRRTLGLALYIVGALLLLDVGVTYARGVVAGDAARTAWERAQAHRVVVLTRQRLAGAPDRTLPPAIGAPTAQLLIPAIGLDEIVVEGVGDDQLNAAPGHLPGSALPGAPGNAIISAHRDRHFHGLDAVAIGDTIVTLTERGRVAWTVIARHIVSRGTPALFATDDATLTLTTCWPVRYLGPAPDRLVITAKPIHPATDPAAS
jgi:sortase A